MKKTVGNVIDTDQAIVSPDEFDLAEEDYAEMIQVLRDLCLPDVYVNRNVDLELPLNYYLKVRIVLI